MSEKANIVENLKRLQEGNAWYGPSLREILVGVTAEKAAAKPIPGFHTIWELVLHIAVWENAFIRRLEGHPMDQPDEGDFPPVKETTAEAWAQTVKYLETTHEKLNNTISKLPDSALQETIVGKDYPVRFMLVGIVQHHVYHAGQIALLKKLP